jgi:hypothetical protein
LIVTLGYEWRATRDTNYPHFVWVACLTLAATPLLGHHVELDSLIPLTLPIILVIVVSRERWKRFGDGIAFLISLFLFGIPWLLYFQGAPQWIRLRTDEILFLFWPVFGLLGLYWIRWWMVRPPRTWLDDFTPKERR